MPGLDGIEAARRIYAERPLPVVMLTAYADRASVERALGAGVFGYVTKPFRQEDIVPAILSALVRHKELLAARREVGKKEEPSSSRCCRRRGTRTRSSSGACPTERSTFRFKT